MRGITSLPRHGLRSQHWKRLWALCLWAESVWLLPRRRARDVGPVDPFGFSWRVAVSLRKPPFMSLGFPWISLDSLVRIETYQWVTRLLAGRIFLAPFSGEEAPERESAVEAMWKRRIVHGASLPRFRIFCKKRPSEPFPFGRLRAQLTLRYLALPRYHVGLG
jgi:hypothetical protein